MTAFTPIEPIASANALAEPAGLPAYPQWDANGNLSQYDGKTFTYDAENRLISVTGTGLSAQFTYDYRNRVTSRTFIGDTTYLIYDDWNLIAEYDETGQQVAKYVHGPRIDEVILTINAHGAFFHHHDVLGSTTHLTDWNGDIIESYTYDPFGAVTVKNAGGTVISQSAYGNRFLFTGREYLEEIDLYDYRNRVYSAELGRFLQTDPIRFDAGDVNIYRYVFNGPLRWIDPFGLNGCSPDGSFSPSFGSTMGSSQLSHSYSATGMNSPSQQDYASQGAVSGAIGSMMGGAAAGTKNPFLAVGAIAVGTYSGFCNFMAWALPEDGE